MLQITNEMRAKNKENLEKTVIAKFKLRKMLESKNRRDAEAAQREANERQQQEEEAAKAAKRAITEKQHKKAQDAWAEKDARRKKIEDDAKEREKKRKAPHLPPPFLA